MRCHADLTAALMLLVFETPARCEWPVGEAFVAIADGYLFRRSPVGSGPNLGAGIGLTHRSGLAVDIEINRTLGLTAKPAPCGIVDLPCEGSAREGVTGATIFSVNARYEFTRARIRPYLTGGVGALWSKGFSSSLYVSEERAVFSEQAWSDTGCAFDFGAGLRIRVTERLSLRPEVRVYNAVALSRANLSMFRPSLVLGFSW